MPRPASISWRAPVPWTPSRTRCTPPIAPRWWATSAASAACSPSRRPRTWPIRCWCRGTDGVGTKLKVAQRLGVHDTVGIDLVAMCVNDILATGAEPLFFLDYVAVGKLDAEAMAKIVGGHRRGLPPVRLRAHRRRDGRASRRDGPGRLRSVRFLRGRWSIARACSIPKACAKATCSSASPRPACIPTATRWPARCASRAVAEEELREAREDLGGQSILEALLTPTRIYVKPVRAVMEAGARRHPRSGPHHGWRHHREPEPRACPQSVNAEVDLGTWPIPPVVRFACEQANLSEAEALKTFNMGLGMVLIVDPAAAEAVEAALAACRRADLPRRPHRRWRGRGPVRQRGRLFA